MGTAAISWRSGDEDRGLDGDPLLQELSSVTGLNAAQVAVALRYYAAYPDEVDERAQRGRRRPGGTIVGSPAEASAGAGALTGLILGHQIRTGGHDVLAALDVEVGLAAKSDEDVQAWAARNSRAVVTVNVSDFARPGQQGSAHNGLVFVSGRCFPRTASGLNRLGEALDALLCWKQLPGLDGGVWLQAPRDPAEFGRDPD